MKKQLLRNSIAFCLTAIGFTALSQTYTTAPYSTGFESGLDPYWTTTSSTSTGEITTFTTGTLTFGGTTANSHSGNYFMGMHNAQPAGSFNLNEADLHLDLSGNSGLRLGFWWSDWNDETHPQDGIYVSDNGGTSFTKVLDLNGDSYTDLSWTHFDLSLDSINALYGLSFTSTYVIRLSQYDDYYFAGGNDGFLFDDLEVYNVCNTGAVITTSACSSYTVPSGDETYTSDGTYYDTIPNSSGCDSLLTIHLTIDNFSATLGQNACDSFTYNGTTYYTSGMYTHTFTSASGCDSIITLSLTITQSTNSNTIVSACGSYTWTDGNNYTQSGIYTQTLSNANGCDSIATLDLTIDPLPAMTVSSSNGISLTANGTADSYTWIDCASQQSVGTGASFEATTNGSYAVIGTNSTGCSDTSACFSVNTVGIAEYGDLQVSLYPNPARDYFYIDAPAVVSDVEIISLSGQTVLRETSKQVNVSGLSNGSYLVRIRFENGATIRLPFVKQ